MALLNLPTSQPPSFPGSGKSTKKELWKYLGLFLAVSSSFSQLVLMRAIKRRPLHSFLMEIDRFFSLVRHHRFSLQVTHTVHFACWLYLKSTSIISIQNKYEQLFKRGWLDLSPAAKFFLLLLDVFAAFSFNFLPRRWNWNVFKYVDRHKKKTETTKQAAMMGLLICYSSR